MLRTLEIAWLTIAIATFCAAIFRYISKEATDAIFMLLVSLVAFMMYMLRKKQRIHQQTEKERKGEQN